MMGPYTFLGEPLTNGKKSAKFVKMSPIILVNPSRRLEGSPRCFGIKSFKSLTWLPKIK